MATNRTEKKHTAADVSGRSRPVLVLALAAALGIMGSQTGGAAPLGEAAAAGIASGRAAGFRGFLLPGVSPRTTTPRDRDNAVAPVEEKPPTPVSADFEDAAGSERSPETK